MTGNLLEIHNGSEYVPVPKIIDYEVDYCKLWSEDTGRSMTGENKGTLVGIFPKIIIKIGQTTEDEMALLLSLFNQASAFVRYYDTWAKAVKTESFYFGDAKDQLKSQRRMTHKQMDISIIANKKRV